jgi:hypothetical protein
MFALAVQVPEEVAASVPVTASSRCRQPAAIYHVVTLFKSLSLGYIQIYASITRWLCDTSSARAPRDKDEDESRLAYTDSCSSLVTVLALENAW